MTTKAKATIKAKATVENTEGVSLDVVKCRVLKKGDGKISTGERKDGKDVTFKKGSVFEVPREIGEVLEDRSYVEIQED
jgi:hypothetical protein